MTPPARALTVAEFRAWVAAEVERIGSQVAFARQLEVPPPRVSELLAGDGRPSPRIVEALGMEWVLRRKQ